MIRKTSCYTHKYSMLIGDDHTSDSTGPDSEIRSIIEVGDTKLISQKGHKVYTKLSMKN